jgi:hypothetical protein
MISLRIHQGTSIDVQILIPPKSIGLIHPFQNSIGKKPVLIVMDYAFERQAYETIDELLKPYKTTFLECGISFYHVGRELEGGRGYYDSECTHQ